MGLFSWLFGKKNNKGDNQDKSVAAIESESQFEDVLKQKETELANVREELSKTKSILTKIQTESNSQIDDKTKSLLSNVTNLQKELEEKTCELKKLSEKTNCSDVQLKSLSDKVTELNKELESKISECQELIKLRQEVEGENKLNLEKIKNQDKKIKDLEDEIEDFEDDIKDLKKKISSKEEENRQLDSKLHESETNLKRSEEENRENQTKLRQADAEIKQLQDSGDFITSLLKAKTVDGKAKEIEKAVYSIQQFVKQELNPFYYRVFNVTDECKNYIGEEGTKGNVGFELLDTWAAQTCKTWLNNKKVISFIGEFSAGKTTIVNSILKSGNSNATELPTSSKATTAIPTYISDGKLAKYTFVSDGVRKEIDKERFEKTSKETLGKIEGISSLISYFVMEYSNPNLAGLSILDTPGFDSNDEDDAKRTLGVVNESDALFWVVDVNRGELNKNSIDVIKKGLSKPLYIIINQCDGKSPSEIESTRKKVEMTVIKEELNVRGYITFGKGMPIENIMSVIRGLQKSNMNNYLYSLQSMVKNDISVYKEAVSESQKAVKNCEDSIDETEGTFESNLQYLRQHADKAASQPHWETHVFSKDRYEMSQYEYNTMVRSLEECKDTCNTLKQNFEVYGHQVNEQVGEIYSLTENKQRDAEMRDLSHKLEVLIKGLETAQM